MNEENFEFLSNNLKYLGFGEDLNDALKEELQKQGSEFQLSYSTVFGKDEVEAILHFRKSHINEMYFFDKYYLHLRKHDVAGELIQPFYIYKGKGITCKEGYNLLCRRAVNKDLTNKEGQSYNAWLQLDLSARENESYKIKQYHQNYGFDLLKALSLLPIKELSDLADQERLIKSLEKGNFQSVVFEKDGREKKMWVEANPRFKKVNVYDSDRHLVKEFSQANHFVEEPAGQKSRNGLEMNGQSAVEENAEREDGKTKAERGIEAPMPVQQRPKRKRISI